ncbi:hypothetical protein QTN25_003728 [Entamoeba marina]
MAQQTEIETLVLTLNDLLADCLNSLALIPFPTTPPESLKNSIQTVFTTAKYLHDAAKEYSIKTNLQLPLNGLLLKPNSNDLIQSIIDIGKCASDVVYKIYIQTIYVDFDECIDSALVADYQPALRAALKLKGIFNETIDEVALLLMTAIEAEDNDSIIHFIKQLAHVHNNRNQTNHSLTLQEGIDSSITILRCLDELAEYCEHHLTKDYLDSLATFRGTLPLYLLHLQQSPISPTYVHSLFDSLIANQRSYLTGNKNALDIATACYADARSIVTSRLLIDGVPESSFPPPPLIKAKPKPKVNSAQVVVGHIDKMRYGLTKEITNVVIAAASSVAKDIPIVITDIRTHGGDASELSAAAVKALKSTSDALKNESLKNTALDSLKEIRDELIILGGTPPKTRSGLVESAIKLKKNAIKLHAELPQNVRERVCNDTYHIIDNIVASTVSEAHEEADVEKEDAAIKLVKLRPAFALIRKDELYNEVIIAIDGLIDVLGGSVKDKNVQVHIPTLLDAANDTLKSSSDVLKASLCINNTCKALQSFRIVAKDHPDNDLMKKSLQFSQQVKNFIKEQCNIEPLWNELNTFTSSPYSAFDVLFLLKKSVLENNIEIMQFAQQLEFPLLENEDGATLNKEVAIVKNLVQQYFEKVDGETNLLIMKIDGCISLLTKCTHPPQQPPQTDGLFNVRSAIISIRCSLNHYDFAKSVDLLELALAAANKDSSDIIPLIWNAYDNNSQKSRTNVDGILDKLWFDNNGTNNSKTCVDLYISLRNNDQQQIQTITSNDPTLPTTINDIELHLIDIGESIPYTLPQYEQSQEIRSIISEISVAIIHVLHSDIPLLKTVLSTTYDPLLQESKRWLEQFDTTLFLTKMMSEIIHLNKKLISLKRPLSMIALRSLFAYQVISSPLSHERLIPAREGLLRALRSALPSREVELITNQLTALPEGIPKLLQSLKKLLFVEGEEIVIGKSFNDAYQSQIIAENIISLIDAMLTENETSSKEFITILKEHGFNAENLSLMELELELNSQREIRKKFGCVEDSKTQLIKKVARVLAIAKRSKQSGNKDLLLQSLQDLGNALRDLIPLVDDVDDINIVNLNELSNNLENNFDSLQSIVDKLLQSIGEITNSQPEIDLLTIAHAKRLRFALHELSCLGSNSNYYHIQNAVRHVQQCMASIPVDSTSPLFVSVTNSLTFTGVNNNSTPMIKTSHDIIPPSTFDKPTTEIINYMQSVGKAETSQQTILLYLMELIQNSIESKSETYLSIIRNTLTQLIPNYPDIFKLYSIQPEIQKEDLIQVEHCIDHLFDIENITTLSHAYRHLCSTHSKFLRDPTKAIEDLSTATEKYIVCLYEDERIASARIMEQLITNVRSAKEVDLKQCVRELITAAEDIRYGNFPTRLLLNVLDLTEIQNLMNNEPSISHNESVSLSEELLLYHHLNTKDSNQLIQQSNRLTTEAQLTGLSYECQSPHILHRVPPPALSLTKTLTTITSLLHSSSKSNLLSTTSAIVHLAESASEYALMLSNEELFKNCIHLIDVAKRYASASKISSDASLASELQTSITSILTPTLRLSSALEEHQLININDDTSLKSMNTTLEHITKEFHNYSESSEQLTNLIHSISNVPIIQQKALCYEARCVLPLPTNSSHHFIHALNIALAAALQKDTTKLFIALCDVKAASEAQKYSRMIQEIENGNVVDNIYHLIEVASLQQSKSALGLLITANQTTTEQLLTSMKQLLEKIKDYGQDSDELQINNVKNKNLTNEIQKISQKIVSTTNEQSKAKAIGVEKKLVKAELPTVIKDIAAHFTALAIAAGNGNKDGVVKEGKIIAQLMGLFCDELTAAIAYCRDVTTKKRMDGCLMALKNLATQIKIMCSVKAFTIGRGDKDADEQLICICKTIGDQLDEGINALAIAKRLKLIY